jgi:hypothetical protein
MPLLVPVWLCGCGSGSGSGSAGAHEDPVSTAHEEPGASAEALAASGDVFFAGGAQRPGEGDNPIVLEWEVDMTNFSVSADHLQVRQDRAAVHIRIADRPEDAFERHGEIPTDVWEATLQTLREQQVCALASQREGDHEEPNGALAVAVSGLRCRVVMPEGEWARQPNARAALAAVTRLMVALAPPSP